MAISLREKKKISFRPLASAICIGSVAALVANTLPVFLSVLSRTRGLSEEQVGLIAFADLGGIAIGTILTAILIKLVALHGWRKTAAVGLLVIVLGNILTVTIDSFYMLLLTRIFTGIGSGIALAIVYVVLSEGDGARDLAIFNVVQLSAGAIGMTILSKIVDLHGPNSPYVLIACLAVLAVAFTFFLPKSKVVENGLVGAKEDDQPVSFQGWVGVASAFVYFCGVGAVYAYLAFMGVAWGGEVGAIEEGLVFVLIAAVIGGLVAAIIGSRFSYKKPLYLGYAGILIAILILMFAQPQGSMFFVVGGLFGFAWNIITPYQFEAITHHVDSSDSAAMLVNACTLGGIAVGPAVAGYMVTAEYMQVNLVAFIATLASLVLIIIAIKMGAKTKTYASHSVK